MLHRFPICYVCGLLSIPSFPIEDKSHEGMDLAHLVHDISETEPGLE